MRLLICAGGTGGGVYPALAVHEALQGLKVEGAQVGGTTFQPSDLETLWVGGEGGMEARLVQRNGIPFRAIPAAGVHGVGLWSLPRNLWQLGRGFFASRRILREFKPDVLFFTGGYVAVPMALAGASMTLNSRRRVPTLLYVPDIEPGLALNTLARFADRIAITAEESTRYFKPPFRPPISELRYGGIEGGRGEGRRVFLTGYPTRLGLAKWKRLEARRSLHLDERHPVLLVLGGSKGARSINNAILANLPALLELTQVLHVTGELDWPEVEARWLGKGDITSPLTKVQAARYHAFPYLHEEMGAALASADLAVSRAGASTLGEYPLFGLPAVLVPYPYAWRYQKVNADYLVGRGAAVLLEDASLSDALLPAVSGLLGHPEKLAAMRAAMQSLSHPRAAEQIGLQLMALSGQRRGVHG